MAQWERPRGSPRLGKDEVHVWRISLSSVDLERARGMLSEDERRRAARYRFPTHRRRFLAARAGLRAILALYLDLDPAAVDLTAGPTGKPRLADNPGLEFNLAHSGDIALVAVTRGRPVGVDVERMRRGIPYERLAERFFAPSEVAALRSLPPPIRSAGFFACWTRKEAWLKASGHGLEGGLPSALPRFAVSVEPDPIAIAVTLSGRPDEAARWSLVDLRVGSGYAGAMAVQGPARTRFYRWAS
ncbi:MAG: 4'-phosphopantetheinyl transferase family protein [Gemmatimonadota bacterium]